MREANHFGCPFALEQYLQCDIAAGVSIMRSIDDAHPARGRVLQDLEAFADDVSGVHGLRHVSITSQVQVQVDSCRGAGRPGVDEAVDSSIGRFANGLGSHPAYCASH